MADAAVSALVKEMVGRLTSLAIDEVGLLWGFKRDISSLADDYKQIEAVLEDAQEEKHVKNKAIGLWLKLLRSASLEVDNVLDEISTDTLLRLLHKQIVDHKVRAFFSTSLNKIKFRVRMAHKVKNIREKVNAIAMASKRFELNSNPSGGISHVVGFVGEMPDRETSSYIHSRDIFGRDEEVEMITKTICNKDIRKYNNDGEIRVYGIWGMGGVGKTTLAQLVYNHEAVDQYFELKCWIYVSQNFQVKEIIKGIITYIDKCECKHTSLEMLQESVQKKLRGKNFLIVLDDVWIEDGEKSKWDQLSKTLSCGVEGSIVVMTTRSQRTSHLFAKVPELQHNLGCLSEEDSWLLFEKFAFAQGREGDDISELKPIGREIVNKCERLPLAIKTLGSLMWSKRSTTEWEHVKGSIIWNLQENNVWSVLKLSYDNLLPYMKKCFAYCCLFPKGQQMERDGVINLWVANGFIPPRGQIDLYELGEEIFNCLVWKSFFQVLKTEKYNDHIDSYKMHDLMHDMARNVMRHDCLVIDLTGMEIEIPNEDYEVLHLSSSCPGHFLCPPYDIGSLTSLRSLLMWEEDINESCISQILNHMYLRVLYLPGLSTFPKSVCKLKHLRYLNLSYSDIEVLPESIIYLQNLQVLLLSYCMRLCTLPDGLRYMTNLQYLDIRYCFNLNHLPLGIKELTSLRIKLSQFEVGNESGARIGELGNPYILTEKLKITKLENVEGLSDAMSANLKNRRNLSVLELHWTATSPPPRAGEVLEGLEPNPNLKELKISEYTGNIISSWIVNLRNLVQVTFFDCSKCDRITSLEMLPNLRVINLKGMSSLKCFSNNDTNNMFPSLEELHIDSCENLISLPCHLLKLKVLGIRGCDKLVSLVETMLPSLLESYIHVCRNLVNLPCDLPKLKILGISGCDKLVSLLENMFPSLLELYVYSCGNLVSLPCNLPKLKILDIRGCDELVSLPDGINDLDRLKIKDCEHLNSKGDIKTGVNDSSHTLAEEDPLSCITQ